jgi:hypothetical protein
MTDYLRHLAARNLNLEKGVAPRVPAFFEPAAYAGGDYNTGSYLEQDSISDKQEVFFESKRKRLHDEIEKPRYGSSIKWSHLGPSISRDASIEASDQSLISGKLEGGRIGGLFPPIQAEPHISPRNAGQRSRSSGTRNSKYILTKQRAHDLGKNQMADHFHMHKPDLPGARREPHNRVRWVATYAQQQHQDSVEISDHPEKRPNQARAGRYDEPEARRTVVPKFDIYQLEMPEKGPTTISSQRDGFQSEGQPEQKNQNNPGYVKKSKKSHPLLSNMVDIPVAQDPSKRAVLDQSLPFRELTAENADSGMGSEKTPGLRESLFGITRVKAISSGSVIDGKSQGDHFNVRKTNDTPNQDKNLQVRGHPSDSSSPDSSSRNDGMVRIKKSAPDSISRDLEKANIFRIGSMIAQSEPSLKERQERQFPPQSNGAGSNIRVTIGRIDVRAERPHHAPSALPIYKPATASRLSLDEYLKKRSTGQI